MRQRIFDLVGAAREGDYASRAYDIFVVVLAAISLVPMLFDSTKITQFESDMLWILDVVTAYFLLFDYVLRWMTHDIKTGKGWKAFFIYPFTPMAIIDILAILPTLNIVPQTLRFLRILRVVKVFRYSKNLLVVTNACYREGRTLGSVFIAVIAYMFVVALIIFNCEPESFKNYFDAVCWACTAMTSVSFSDSRPVGYIGQGLSILSSLVALLVVALPAGVITGAYINESRESKKVGSRYFKMTGRARIRFSELDSPKVWLNKNRKVFRYFTVIICCILINTALSLFLISIGSPIWMTSISAAVAAYLLEPAAGIIMAFVAAVLSTFVIGDTSTMLVFFTFAAIALGFGFLFPRENSKHKGLHYLALLGILVFVCGTINADVYLIKFHGDVGATVDWCANNGFAGVYYVDNLGMPEVATLLLGMFLDRFFETIPLINVFAVIVKLLGIRAAPSEKELKQQQKILLDRALAQEQLENEEARKIARETLERKHAEVVREQAKLAEERELLERRLEEMRAEG